MKTLKVTLKQHTPLIHFQHDQEGATLRASEVKPKLDRYILGKLGYGKGLDKVKKAWLISEKPSLDYKIKIISSGEKQEYLIASYLSQRNKNILEEQGIMVIDQSPFFAQEKENSEIVSGNRNWNDIRSKGIVNTFNVIEIYSCSHDDLIDEISNYIQSFFAFENFGMRQDKGFGCFTVEDIKVKGLGGEKQILVKPIEKLLMENYSIRYKKRLSDNNLSYVFKIISDDYKILKSGKNRPYAKSKLMLYGLQSKQRWEKKFFKEYIDEIYQRDDGEYYKLKNTYKKDVKNLELNDDEDYYYMRALLGVANQYEFLLSNPPSANKKMIVSVKSSDVERFKSPILFKVIDGFVYLLGNSIPSEILSNKFYFEVNIQGDSGYKDDRIVEDLYTPDSFNLKKFIDFAMGNRGNGAVLNYQKF